MVNYSILDLAYINEGDTARDAFHRSLDLAQLADKTGYERFWVAEHHNMINIASAATSVFIGYLAAGTENIRIGAGGIMLPNHAPLMVAEQFGTLESLYPGRIDLGLGRAPGTDPLTSHALRRDPNRANTFPDEVVELLAYFHPSKDQKIFAIPGSGLDIPVWILGSSLFGAQLAAALGLPYCFAAHFAPTHLYAALETYRNNFKPSQWLDEPYAMVCMNAVVAESDDEARYQFSTMQQSFTNLIRNDHKLAPHPITNIEDFWTPYEEHQVNNMLRFSAVGSEKTVQNEIEAILDKTDADELMFAAAIYNNDIRLDSFKRLSEVMKRINQ